MPRKACLCIGILISALFFTGCATQQQSAGLRMYFQASEAADTRISDRDASERVMRNLNLKESKMLSTPAFVVLRVALGSSEDERTDASDKKLSQKEWVR